MSPEVLAGRSMDAIRSAEGWAGKCLSASRILEQLRPKQKRRGL